MKLGWLVALCACGSPGQPRTPSQLPPATSINATRAARSRPPESAPAKPPELARAEEGADAEVAESPDEVEWPGMDKESIGGLTLFATRQEF